MIIETTIQGTINWVSQDMYHMMIPVVGLAALVIFRTVQISFSRSKYRR